MQLLFFNYKKRFLIVLLYSFIFFTSLGLLYDIFNYKKIDIVIDTVLILLSFTLLYIVRKFNHLVFATLILFWFATIVVFYYNILYKFDSNTLYFIIIPIIAIVLLPLRLVIINLSIYFTALFTLFYYGYQTMPHIPFFQDNLMNLVIVVGYVIVFAWLYHNTIETSYQMLLKLHKQKELLLLELHHRTKNNLNLLISLLGLEQSQSKELQEFIERYKSRINSIALIHEMLYFEKRFDKIDVAQYISKLATHLVDSFSKKIELSLQITPLCTDLTMALNLGLIINEWILNSIKHAFSNTQEAKIFISLYKKENKVYIEYKDNGNSTKKPLKKRGIGTTIVTIATEQIEGQMKKESDNTLKLTIQGDRFEYCNSRR